MTETWRRSSQVLHRSKITQCWAPGWQRRARSGHVSPYFHVATSSASSRYAEIQNTTTPKYQLTLGSSSTWNSRAIQSQRVCACPCSISKIERWKDLRRHRQCKSLTPPTPRKPSQCSHAYFHSSFTVRMMLVQMKLAKTIILARSSRSGPYFLRSKTRLLALRWRTSSYTPSVTKSYLITTARLRRIR